MSISGTLSNALSGLTAAARSAEVVSNNVSNALTPGYGTREVELSAHVLGGAGAGVRVDGVTRHSDPILIGNRRLSEAGLGRAEVGSGFLDEIEAAIGLPDAPGSLTSRITALEGRLIEAASRPDSSARQTAAVGAAKDVAGHLNTLSDRLQTERMEADSAIAGAVDKLNDTLGRVAELNGQIARFQASSRDAAALMDQRQALIDGIADLVPLREVPRQDGTVALFTPGGAILLEGKPAEIGFTPAGVITPDMTQGSGALSGLTVNGRSVSTDAESGPIAGGRLAGLFAVRDTQATELQTRLDGVARDLIERFEDSAVDPTRAPGDPGLFTDAGAAFDPAEELGLAGRVAVNALVDPAAGGETWRLKDGLGAAAPGDPGDAGRLPALGDALAETRVAASGGFGAVPRSAAGLASDLLSGVSVEAAGAAADVTYARSQTDTLTNLELQGGVDTDAEMQKLLLIERTYAANARVVQTVDRLLQSLIGI